MTYNPDIHHRKSIRYKGYDYSKAGYYYITICCQDKKCRFGHIQENEMILNEFGQIAYDVWNDIPNRYDSVSIDIFQIMPNHLHGIIIINDMWL